jgi:diguanylate cyclase (GGDEF)-like protein
VSAAGSGDAPAEARGRRRAERQRQARLEAERIAERTTRSLHDALSELRGAEARTRIVTETAALLPEGGLDMEGTLEAVADAARRALGARGATFFIGAPDGVDRVDTVVTVEAESVRRAGLTGVAGGRRPALELWRRAGGASLVSVPDAGNDRRVPARLRRLLDAGALVGVRLEALSCDRRRGPTVLGAFLICWEEAREIGRHDELVARSLAGLAALAVENARLHEATLGVLDDARERAAQDPLTGLANHRTFHDRLGQEVARAGRHGRQLSLALFDLDRFKRVNDLHGHQAGDRALQALARVLGETAREGDMVARVGGEEFAWLMPETDALEAWHAAERARETISCTHLPGIGRVSVSAGVCGLEQASDAADLYRLADGALYWAKHHGRDVVFRYSPEVVRALSAEEQALGARRQQALQSIRMLARAVDAKDSFTRRHSERVADMAARIAARLGWSPERIELLHGTGLVHDVGKLAIPDHILTRPGPLTAEEYEQLKTHAAIGAEIVSEAFDAEQVAWVRGHHERWDGGGYPDGLAGGQITEGAAILALADAWDAMTSARPYRSAGRPEDAVDECLAERGRQFAPWAVDALLALRAAEGSGAATPEPRASSRTR